MKALKHQRGLSLVELLVALTIGGFLIIGAITMQSQTRRTFTVNEQQARLQETARFVFSVVEPEVQLAGLYGFSNVPDGVSMKIDEDNTAYASDMRTVKDAIEGMPEVLDGCGKNYVVDVSQTVTAGDGEWDMDCDAGGGGYLDGTDTLTVRRTSVDKVDPKAGRIQLYTSRINREQQQLFMDGVAPGPIVDDMSEVRDLIMKTFYVSPSSDGRPALPSLRLKQITEESGAGKWDDQEVVRGVEDLQIELGIDPGEDRNGDGEPDDVAGDGMPDYVNGQVANWVAPGDAAVEAGAQVVAVRIWVRVRAEEPEAGFVNRRKYKYGNVEFTPNDGYRRVLMSRTVYLRNSRAFPSSS
ncbi:MAG TPA: PilW family protein [Steroidobacteraceae bacterium]|nr:PilW family protein [Steroidobacteraceae bacterium]